MATPRVFISSTCYDLKYVRENLKYFVRTIGYEPVLSDEGDVFYSPSAHTHDSCLKEVETCQIFILIIGGRQGGNYKAEVSSITNNEYREAVQNNIPIFALVETSVHSDHHVFVTNKKKNPTIAESIAYPSIDDIRIFGFIDEVRKNTKNNAIFPFRDFSDMESYLKKQWAGMMYDFIIQRANNEKSKITNKLLDDLTLATKKSEELIKILLKSSDINGNVEKAIQEVSNRVQAENFANLVLSKFSIDRLRNTSLKDLEGIPLQGTWIDFLEATNDFRVEEMVLQDDEIDLVLWCNSSHGIQIGSTTNGEFSPVDYHNLEESFSSLKSVDEDARRNIFLKLVNGL
ncbi:MAG: DUF4062 domain-containing protein [Gammaproteobacteria bacterium]|nr:DUF4062 domain-containing protein [Gammaproteobacteria bacterium]